MEADRVKARHRNKVKYKKIMNVLTTNEVIIKITANVIVISLLRTFRPSAGATVNAQ